MCGRFAMDQETNDLIEEFVAQGNDFREWRPQYSIAPTDTVPIVRERAKDGEIVRTIEPAAWDFHPPFIKDAKRPQFNARLETVATLGLWKSAFASSRCIVPMRGYYEWEPRIVNGKEIKQPHFIHGPGRILAAAGIATARQIDGAWQVSTAIITREARDASGEIHDRMPVFLPDDVYDEWLTPVRLETPEQKEHMLELLRDVSGGVASKITTYEVDRKVNSTRSADPADPTLIEPLY